MPVTIPDVPDPDIPIRQDTAVLDTQTDTNTTTVEKASGTTEASRLTIEHSFRRELMQALEKLPADLAGNPMTVRSENGHFYLARFPKLAGEQPAEEGAEVDDVVITPLQHMNDRKPGPDWTFRMNGHLSVEHGGEVRSIEELRALSNLRRQPVPEGTERDPLDLQRSDVATQVHICLTQAISLVNAEAWKQATKRRQAELQAAQDASAARVRSFGAEGDETPASAD